MYELSFSTDMLGLGCIAVMSSGVDDLYHNGACVVACLVIVFRFIPKSISASCSPRCPPYFLPPSLFPPLPASLFPPLPPSS